MQLLNVCLIFRAPRRALDYWKFLRRERSVQRREVLFVLVLAAATVVVEAAGLTMILPILSYVEHDGDITAFSQSSPLTKAIVDTYQYFGVGISIISLSVVAFLLIVLRQSLNYVNSVEIERLKWKAGRRLAVRFFTLVLGSRAENIRHYKPGHFLNDAYNECQATAAIIRSHGTIWMQVITLAAYSSVLFVTAPVASLVAFGVIILAMLSLATLFRITGRLSEISVGYRQDYANFLNERIRAWKLIKLSNTLDIESGKAADIQESILANQIHLLKVSGALALIFVPLLSGFLLLTLYVFVEVLTLEVAVVIAFILILLRLMPVSQGIQSQLNRLAQFMPSFDLVQRSMDRARALHEDLDTGQTVETLETGIDFDAVSFAYQDRDDKALKNISVVIPARKMTAIVGPSGSGKSTLVDLIPRIIDPDSGTVSLDDVPVSQISLRSLRKLIAYVPQEPFLFDATIADNIRYLRPDADMTAVERAAGLANAAEFIKELPQGYETRLGDSGAGLSGGQKQRIVLARAFLSGAPILILDEPTSALDQDSELQIQQSVENLVKEHALTVIVIAHRLSTVRNADLVIRLDEGSLSQIGSADAVLGALTDAEKLQIEAQQARAALG